ncbi:MAG: hypothetical protein J5836_00495 [Clostridia bacterium]|nr:hypothetical protein [Clostridia bacterium]
MITDLYKVLNLTESATDEEIEARYQELKAKYSEDRFKEGEEGNVAARNLTELETAYREIVSTRREIGFSSEDGGYYKEIEAAIKRGDLAAAQNALDSFNERNAEWHYLQSVVFYKKNWSNESKKQLEIAIQMDPNNEKYKTSYKKLNDKINSASNSGGFTDYSGNSARNGEPRRAEYYEDRQMGGDGCMEWCCQMALCNMMLNCCCNCR